MRFLPRGRTGENPAGTGRGARRDPGGGENVAVMDFPPQPPPLPPQGVGCRMPRGWAALPGIGAGVARKSGAHPQISRCTYSGSHPGEEICCWLLQTRRARSGNLTGMPEVGRVSGKYGVFNDQRPMPGWLGPTRRERRFCVSVFNARSSSWGRNALGDRDDQLDPRIVGLEDRVRGKPRCNECHRRVGAGLRDSIYAEEMTAAGDNAPR
jgi:hypothetical protein